MAKIRDAINSDRVAVLEFCKDTFSWGDYVEHVWNFWLSEGGLFVAQQPDVVGVCHASYSDNQSWIEGVRIKPAFRRQNIATELIRHAEAVSLERNIHYSYMLIETENHSSISMAHSLGYAILETWNFHSLVPKPNPNHTVGFTKSPDCKAFTHYVNSWRWMPLDVKTLKSMCDKDRVVHSRIEGEETVAILADSEHFENTLVVTLSAGSDESACDVLRFLQDYGYDGDYYRIQILSRERLPDFDSLESRMAFHLMKKSLV